MKTKKKPEPQAHHYFASSVGEWKVRTDCPTLVREMRKNGLEFTLWRVPHSIETPYEIRRFTPQIEGAEYLGQFAPDPRA
jgi:hypothetical protein